MPVSLHLTPERVWKETESARLTTRNPQVFFQTLRDCRALKVLFRVDALYGVPAPLNGTRKIDTGLHT